MGGATLVEAFAHCGLGIPEIVEEQFEPDGSFPTVPFPNPEEVGAMDAVIELAQRAHCDLASLTTLTLTDQVAFPPLRLASAKW